MTWRHANGKGTGFTLLELIISLSILLVIMGISTMAMRLGQDSWTIVEAQTHVQEEYRKTMTYLASDLSGGSVESITGVPADGQWYKRISFQKLMGMVSGEPVLAAVTTYGLGGMNNTQLIAVEGNTRKVIANNVASFSIRRMADASAVVHVSVIFQKDARRNEVRQRQLNIVIKLRN